jgi:predicted  nucleic acid-binding Zn-ribbon protein
LDDIDKAIEDLNNAELLNKDIPEKAKHFMEGNRDQLIRLVTKFKEGVFVPGRPENIKQFYEETNSALIEMLPQIQRPFNILTEFFANEAKEIMHRVHAVDKISKELLRVHAVDKISKELLEISKKYNLDAVSSIEKTIDQMKNAEVSKQKLQEEIKAKEDEVKEANNKLEASENKIKDLEDSDEYKSLMNLKKELQQVISNMKNLRSEMVQKFHTIEPALKKYERITLHNQEMVKDYIITPVETLARDRDLTLLLIIESMKKEIEEDSIDLKDKKKDKVLAAMDEFDEVMLNEFLRTYGSLTLEQQDLMRQIQSLDVLQRISVLRRDSERLRNERNAFEHDLLESKNKLEATTTESFISKIKDLAREGLYIDLKIS